MIDRLLIGATIILLIYSIIGANAPPLSREAFEERTPYFTRHYWRDLTKGVGE